ncbi:hypothetical protein TNCV_3385941 [Trichonephila clavipes]|nr:hypothetical protein TNCV_3385941 [Trichonephila clavipes]
MFNLHHLLLFARDCLIILAEDEHRREQKNHEPRAYWGRTLLRRFKKRSSPILVKYAKAQTLFQWRGNQEKEVTAQVSSLSLNHGLKLCGPPSFQWRGSQEREVTARRPVT